MSSAPALIWLSGRVPRPAGDDVHVTGVRVLDTSAWIAFRRDQGETDRRAANGLGAVPAWDLLDTLMDLPAGLPVPLAALTRPARRRVVSAPAGVARVVAGQMVTRDLVPAVFPLLAVVAAGDWMSGLTRASRFAPYCPRIALGPDLPVGGDVLEVAGRLGIGVAVRRGSGPADVLAEPEPVPGWQPTTAWWRFCELVYGQAQVQGLKLS